MAIGPNLTLLALMSIGSIAIGQVASSPLRFRDDVELTSLHLESNGFRTVADNNQFYVQTAPNKYVAVDLDGHTHTALDTSLIPATVAMSPKGMFLMDLSPVPGHGVVAPVAWATDPPIGQPDRTALESHVGILSFDEHGQYEDLTELNVSLNLTRLAEFSNSGSYLVSGYDNQGTPKLLLLDHAGNIKPMSVLPWMAKKEEKGGQSKESIEEKMNKAAAAAAQVKMVSGEDNAVYVYNPIWGARVIRIRSDGTFSEITLAGKIQDASAVFPLAMLVAHGSIYIDETTLQPSKPGQSDVIRNFVLHVYDANDGTEEKTYSLGTGFGGNPVSVGEGILYFLDANVVNNVVRFSLVSIYA